MPSRIWYAVAAGIFCLSVIGTAAIIFIYHAELHNQIGQMARLTVPGRAQIHLPEGGEHTIYYEWGSVGSSDLVQADDIPDLKIELQEVDGDKTKVDLGEEDREKATFIELRWGTSYSYEYNGRTGRSVYQFRITKPGTYQVTAANADGRGDPVAGLAIGKGIDRLIFLTSLGGVLLYFGGISLSVALLAWTFFKRRTDTTSIGLDTGR